MITIAIINLKGGVGKSVTTCNLAAELAATHKSVLVVDLDKQANTTKFYEALDYEMASVADVLTGDYKANEVICKTSDLEIGLLPANMNLLKANRQILLDTTEPQQVRLREALYPLADDWDFALLDCPPDLDMGSINALCAADTVIVPVQCEYYALEGLSDLLSTIRIVKRSLNPQIALEGVVLTMYDGRTNLSLQVAEEVKRHFPGQVYATVIPRNVRLSEAPSHGKPVCAYDSLSRGAEAYEALARELLEQNRGQADR